MPSTKLSSKQDKPLDPGAEPKSRRGSNRHEITPSLGMELRRRRNEVGLSLRELARRLDVSPSLVSQIETDKIRPSVGTLYAMVSELGISFDDVFSAGGASGEEKADVAASPRVTDAAATLRQSARVQRADTRQGIDLESGVRWERLTTWNDREVDFLFMNYVPGGASSSDGKLVPHSGREFGIVLTGQLNVTVGAEEHLLEPGDSISFESAVPHRLHNDGTEPVTAIWVVLGRDA